MHSSPYFVFLALTGVICATTVTSVSLVSSTTESSSESTLTSTCSLATSISVVPTEHNVTVGGSGTLSFDPSEVDANIGDIIRFSFLALNHTLTQSSLSDPCTSIGSFSTGFNQFNPENVSGEFIVNYWVNTHDPQWFFCAQTDPKSHCKSGMIFALNAGTKMQAFASAATQTSLFTDASSAFNIPPGFLSTSQTSETKNSRFSTTSPTDTVTTVDVATVPNHQATSSLPNLNASTVGFTAAGTKYHLTMGSAYLCFLAMFLVL